MLQLTIVVPSYNVEKYLHKALSSYADSRFEGLLEVLIVNDGSTDSTVEIAQEYVSKFPIIFILINKRNGGHGSTINTGIQYAKGRYLRIVDGDDWVITENLYLLLQKMQHVDTDLIVDMKRNVQMDTGGSIAIDLPGGIQSDVVYDIRDLDKNKSVLRYLSMPVFSIKTSILRENLISLLEHTFYVDYEYVVKSVNYFHSLIFLNLEIYQYLIGNIDQSISVGNFVKRYGQHERVILELLRFSKTNLTNMNFTQTKIRIGINMQYLILLIYDKNRHEGRIRAMEFRSKLRNIYPEYWKLTRLKYYILVILHAVGVDAIKYDMIKKSLKYFLKS
jgi:glycosyltransferase involved in cell wall biosynthesis